MLKILVKEHVTPQPQKRDRGQRAVRSKNQGALISRASYTLQICLLTSSFLVSELSSEKDKILPFHLWKSLYDHISAFQVSLTFGRDNWSKLFWFLVFRGSGSV